MLIISHSYQIRYKIINVCNMCCTNFNKRYFFYIYRGISIYYEIFYYFIINKVMEPVHVWKEQNVEKAIRQQQIGDRARAYVLDRKCLDEDVLYWISGDKKPGFAHRKQIRLMQARQSYSIRSPFIISEALIDYFRSPWRRSLQESKKWKQKEG